MRVLTILGGILAALVTAILVTSIAARFHDGPLGMLPGGPLAAGELVSTPVEDWGFAEEVETIELQLEQDETSRTVWILVRDGRAYIPCSLGFPPGKSWHTRAKLDGRAVVRISGKRYPVELTRIDSPPVEASLKRLVAAKYSGGPPGDAGVWYFSFASRSS
jgi:hypothetical protein